MAGSSHSEDVPESVKHIFLATIMRFFDDLNFGILILRATYDTQAN